MAIQLKSARVERWPVAGKFVISRGASDHVDVVVAEVEEDGVAGRGEGTPIYYQGEDAAGCRDALLRVMPHLAGLGASAARAAVQELMGAGAARNAIDCALWDLEARQRAVPLWQLAGYEAPAPRVTAFTISLGGPGTMAARTEEAVTAGYRLLKIKLADAADAAGLSIMVGCMLSTSLAIAPAFLLAQRARWVDLDGPALLARDRADGFCFANGEIGPVQ
jgi:L-alanine-DL-glutamate epimerase-like enolase superfamily enzyme